MTTTVLAFEDSFTGAAGALSGHTPELGTWTPTNTLRFRTVGDYITSNGTTYASEIQIDGSGNRIIANVSGYPHGFKAVASIPGADYGVLLMGTFVPCSHNEYVLIALRAALDGAHVNYVGIEIVTGADDGEIHIFAVDRDYTNGLIWRTEIWNSATPPGTIQVQVIGDRLIIAVDSVVVHNRMISAGQLVDAPGDVYLVEQAWLQTATLDYFNIEATAGFWTDLVKTFEVDTVF